MLDSNLIYQINPDRERPWDELPGLPIHESLYRSVEVFEQLGRSKESLGRLYGRSVAIPNQGLLINSISLQEAKASSAIENVFTTDDELYKAYSDPDQQLEGPAKEVLNYREALWKGYHTIKQKNVMDEAYFIEIYRVVKQATDGIRPSFLQTYIKQGGSGAQAGKVAYTPPRDTRVIEEKLRNLIDFLNDDIRFPMDTLLKMAIGHFQFEAIHPFRDGNGRTGRIVNIHYLTQKGLLEYPILYMSNYINSHKEDYYHSLSGVSQRGDWETWILFMLKAVEITSTRTFDKINSILSVKEAIQLTLEKESRIKRPDQLVQHIFTQPYTKVKHLVESKMFSENTARGYLNRLVEFGILEKKTIGGHHYYLNIELNRILGE